MTSQSTNTEIWNCGVRIWGQNVVTNKFHRGNTKITTSYLLWSVILHTMRYGLYTIHYTMYTIHYILNTSKNQYLCFPAHFKSIFSLPRPLKIKMFASQTYENQYLCGKITIWKRAYWGTFPKDEKSADSLIITNILTNHTYQSVLCILTHILKYLP